MHLFRVVGGLDTLDKMEKVKTDDKDRPLVCSGSVVHGAMVATAHEPNMSVI